MSTEVKWTEQEWQSLLTPEQYQVLRQKGTERPFSGRYVDTKQDGVYRCAACGNELFDADAKFESDGLAQLLRAGQPPERERSKQTPSHGMVRTEVSCARCGSHLGHVFDDGPAETGSGTASTLVALDLEQR